MTHNEKLDLMFRDLAQRGVGRWTFAPPVYRLLWKLGFEVPPPLFSSFNHLLIVQGTTFGTLWGFSTWLLLFTFFPVFPAWIFLLLAIPAGVLFGLCMAAIYRWQARSLKLPNWSEYGRA